MNRLYHKKIWWHKDFDTLAVRLFNTNYSEHLWEHLLFDKDKHNINIRTLENIINDMVNKKKNYYLYEIETQGYNDIIKAVVRTSYNLDRDISIVFAISKKNELIVKTAWLNDKKDSHVTLNKYKYYKPKKYLTK